MQDKLTASVRGGNKTIIPDYRRQSKWFLFLDSGETAALDLIQIFYRNFPRTLSLVICLIPQSPPQLCYQQNKGQSYPVIQTFKAKFDPHVTFHFNLLHCTVQLQFSYRLESSFKVWSESLRWHLQSTNGAGATQDKPQYLKNDFFFISSYTNNVRKYYWSKMQRFRSIFPQNDLFHFRLGGCF